MAKARKNEDLQQELVPLTEKQLEDAKVELAKIVGDIEEVEAERKETVGTFTKKLKGLRKKQSSVASQIRKQGR